MNEQLYNFATSPHLVIPTAVLLTMVFLYWQKKTIKKKNTELLDSTFIVRNSLFVGVIALFIVYFNKPLPRLEESFSPSPAEF
jgi:type IV secretory pathway TrbL component